METISVPPRKISNSKLFVFELYNDSPYNKVEYWFRPSLESIIDVIEDYWGMGCNSFIILITLGEIGSEVILDVGEYFSYMQKKVNTQHPMFDSKAIKDKIKSMETIWNGECYKWPDDIEEQEFYICNKCEVFYLGNLQCTYCSKQTVLYDT